MSVLERVLNDSVAEWITPKISDKMITLPTKGKYLDANIKIIAPDSYDGLYEIKENS